MNNHAHGDSIGHDHPSSHGTTASKEQVHPSTFGTHNQMMVGEQTIYLSHLPMFDPAMPEHNFRVILEVTLSGPGNTHATYVNDRRKHPTERMYTMSPDPFEMIELDPRHPKRATLTGDIFRGHLERGGQVLIPRAEARVVNIVYFHQFDPNAKPLGALEYLLFGRSQDLLLAHLITRPPDFDQILSVKISNGELTADDLKRGVRIHIPNRTNTPTHRIKMGDRVNALAQIVDAQGESPTDDDGSNAGRKSGWLLIDTRKNESLARPRTLEAIRLGLDERN